MSIMNEIKKGMLDEVKISIDANIRIKIPMIMFAMLFMTSML